MNAHKRTPILSILIALFVSLPLVIYSYEQTGIPLSDLLLPWGLALYVAYSTTTQGIALTLTLLFSLITLLASNLLFSQEISHRNLFSLIFFLKPTLFYFIGHQLSKNKSYAITFFKYSNYFLFLFYLASLLDILANHNGVLRADSYINGSFLGLPIFGSYGVNSLAAFYFLSLFISSFNLELFFHNTLQRLISITILAISTLFVFASLSRMTILGALLLLFMAYLGLRAQLKIKFGLAILVFLLLATYYFDFSSISNFTEAKIHQITTGIQNSDINYISSGRISLYISALKEFFDNPFIGSYFGGYTTLVIGFPETTGLSPHNMYITAFWKMGLLGGILYFYFFYSAVSATLRHQDTLSAKWSLRLTITLLLVFFSLWDVLIIPNFSAIVFLLLGIFSNPITYHETTKDSRARVCS